MSRDILDGLPEIGRPPADSTLEALVLSAMREAFFYARKCCRGMLADDDIYSACYDGLSKAAANFKPGGIRFFAYAKPYVRGALSTVWRSKDVVKRCKNRILPPESRVVAERPEAYEGADGLTGILIEEKRNTAPPSVEPELDSIQVREEFKLIEPLLKSELTDKEQSVVVLRYKAGLTFQRIGSLLGSSREDIRATHGRAIAKLRQAAKAKLGHY